MHKYLRAAGFSEYTAKKKIQELVKQVIIYADERLLVRREDHTTLVEFRKDFADNLGIAVCGEFDEEQNFSYDYYYPYLKGVHLSSQEDISVERHAARESYAGICEDVKVGVSLIFYLLNMTTYLKFSQANKIPCRGTSLNLSAMSCQGTIMMPIQKNENQKKKIQKDSMTRNQLIQAAREGDEEAIESLTLEDMDTYTTISNKIHKEDVFSLVDTYFMPYGAECDQYSVLGEIMECRLVTNSLTKEQIYLLTICANELTIDVCVNIIDLFGEPQVGRRFKGTIWLQGFINFPE